MTFLTSILLGLCMGSGAVFSTRYGQRDEAGLREGACAAFPLIAGAAASVLWEPDGSGMKNCRNQCAKLSLQTRKTMLK